MTDGRIYTLDAQIDATNDDLRRATKRRDEILAGNTGEPEENQAVRRLTALIESYRQELAELCAQQIAEAEGFRS